MLFIIRNYMSLAKDLFTQIEPQKILIGNKLFRPFLSYQNAWLKYFYNIEKLNTKRSTWSYLHEYVMPLVLKNASSYHLEGIERLELNTQVEPEFTRFSKIFSTESSFTIEPVTTEIPPLEYFKFISQKKFPCIFKTRMHEELFCGFEPDFWHETVGHLAPLCHVDVQDFYLKLADIMLSTKTNEEFEAYLSVAFTLTEYGFIKDKQEEKMFGAALVGSHLAHMRYINKLIEIEPASRKAILDARYIDETAPLPRNKNGKLRFFCLENLDLLNMVGL